MTDEVRFSRKKIGPHLGPADLNQTQNEVFAILLSLYHTISSKLYDKIPKKKPKFGFLPCSQVSFISFPLNYIDDSFEQCLTSTRGKTHKKNRGTKFGLIRSKSGPKLYFSKFSQVLFISFSVNRIT